MLVIRRDCHYTITTILRDMLSLHYTNHMLAEVPLEPEARMTRLLHWALQAMTIPLQVVLLDVDSNSPDQMVVIAPQVPSAVYEL